MSDSTRAPRILWRKRTQLSYIAAHNPFPPDRPEHYGWNSRFYSDQAARGFKVSAWCLVVAFAAQVFNLIVKAAS